ncbi:hypothetical protein [Streptomyces hilarionis]|nr:hypothetical protein [Streptomyces hilarionis]
MSTSPLLLGLRRIGAGGVGDTAADVVVEETESDFLAGRGWRH